MVRMAKGGDVKRNGNGGFAVPIEGKWEERGRRRSWHCVEAN
jgi:hypothetical protein